MLIEYDALLCFLCICMNITFSLYQGDLEDLFPWPAGFYESVTKKSEHTVSEVDHSKTVFRHLFPIFWSWHLINLSHCFQFRTLLKAVGFEGIIVEKRETEKMENKTEVPLQTFYLPKNRRHYTLHQSVLCNVHFNT